MKRDEKNVVDKTKHRGVAECKKKKKKRGRRRRLFFFGAKKARTTGKSLLPRPRILPMILRLKLQR
jgi:hypothetical protein